jgi:hypothetical protein
MLMTMLDVSSPTKVSPRSGGPADPDFEGGVEVWVCVCGNWLLFPEVPHVEMIPFMLEIHDLPTEE